MFILADTENIILTIVIKGFSPRLSLPLRLQNRVLRLFSLKSFRASFSRRDHIKLLYHWNLIDIAGKDRLCYQIKKLVAYVKLSALQMLIFGHVMADVPLLETTTKIR